MASNCTELIHSFVSLWQGSPLSPITIWNRVPVDNAVNVKYATVRAKSVKKEYTSGTKYLNWYLVTIDVYCKESMGDIETTKDQISTIYDRKPASINSLDFIEGLVLSVNPSPEHINIDKDEPKAVIVPVFTCGWYVLVSENT